MSYVDIATNEQRVSYGIGRQMGDQLASNPFDGLVPELVAKGLLEALAGEELAVAPADLESAFAYIQQKMQEKSKAEAGPLAEAGEKFLAENATKSGVIVTQTGLQYQVLTEGGGAKPSASSVVKTHYHGTLTDGTVFDSSVERGEPAEFPVNRVIAGWTEALQMMPVGSKWRLFIPYQLAYGEQGAGGAIKPYSALIFDVELIDIVS
jgi:FKBP-type peptidyl-prolyl cis-trans isomerase FklB